jgi:N-carbamoylputrescine amidase
VTRVTGRRTLNVALLQLAASGYDQAANLEKGVAACRRAAARGADLALFPEMWNVGYAFEDADVARWRAQAVPRHGPFVRRFADLAAELGMAVAVTYLERGEVRPGEEAPPLRNSLSLFDRRGDEVLTYAKVHICGFEEPEAELEPGASFPVASLETGAGEVKVGAMICFDREFPEAARVLAVEGAELILVPNACEMEANRLGQLRARAFENMVAVAMANYPAPQQNGHSAVYDPIAFDEEGKSRDTRVAEAGTGEELTLAGVDLEALRERRRGEVWGGPWRRPETYAALTRLAGASVVLPLGDVSRRSC